VAVQLEFINVIVPIKNIEKCEKIGGWKGFLERNQGLMGETDWCDDHLFRTGAMNPLDLQDIVEDWKGYGLQPLCEENGVKLWNDLCVIDSANGLTLPCDWIELDLERRCAWIKGSPEGPIVGRASGETYEGVVIK